MKKLSILLLSVFLLGGLLAGAQAWAEEEGDGIIAEVEITAEDLEISDPLILPNNPLYIFKDLWRGLRATFTFNEVKKAELRLEYANKRLFEANKLAEKDGKETIVARAMEKYQKEITKIEAQVERFKDKAGDSPEIDKFLDKFTDKSLKQQKLMDNLENNLSDKPEVLARIREIKENSLERFGVVMEELEEKHKIQERIENNLEEYGEDAKYKNFKDLEVLIRLEDKVSEEAKEAIQQAQENALKRLHNNLELMAPEDQERFGDYIDGIGGDPSTHLMILKDLEAEGAVYGLQKEIEQKRIEVQERVRVIEKEAIQSMEQIQERVQAEVQSQVQNQTQPQTQSQVQEKVKEQVKEQACIAVWDPICGEDGKTYSNACFAQTAGTEVGSKGACGTGGIKAGR